MGKSNGSKNYWTTRHRRIDTNTHEYDTSPKEPKGLTATNTNTHTNRIHGTNSRGWTATHPANRGWSTHHVNPTYTTINKKISRRAAEQRDRRPAELPTTRQTRRNYDAAATRMRRQAHTSQHSMDAQDQARTRHPDQRTTILRHVGRLHMPLRLGSLP